MNIRSEMKTFLQSLKSQNINHLVKEAFILLEKKSVSSLAFVEWYSNEGLLLNEQATLNWVKSRIRFEENSVEIQNHMVAANKALSDLHSRLTRSVNLREKANSKEFAQMVLNLISMLNDPNQVYVEPSQVSLINDPNAPNEHYSRFVSRIRIKNEMNRFFNEMEKRNINPSLFIEWYQQEGQFLTEGPYFDRFKDFVGNTWANIKGAWNRGMSGFFGPGQERQKSVDLQRDQAAINNTKQALTNLVNQISQLGIQPQNNFMNVVQQITQQLDVLQTELQQAAQTTNNPAQTNVAPQPPVQQQPSYNYDDGGYHESNLR